MKKLFSALLLTVLSVAMLQAKTVNSITAMGLWNDPTSWSCSCIPLDTDSVLIQNGNTIVLAVTTDTIAKLNVSAGGTLNGLGNELIVTDDLLIDGQVFDFSNFTWQGINKTLYGAGNFTSINTFSIIGAKFVHATADIQFSTSNIMINGPHRVYNHGTLNLPSANIDATDTLAMLVNEASGELNFGSQVFLTKGILVAATPGNHVNYYGNLNQVIKDPDDCSYYHLTLSNSGTKSLTNPMFVRGNLNLIDNTQLDPSNQFIKINGDWNNTSTHGDPFVQGTATVHFTGSNGQRIINANGEEAFYNLTINNTNNNGVTLLTSVNVSNHLELTNGRLFTSSGNILVLSDNATSNGGNSGSFVAGPMRKIGNDAFIFPVGQDTVWARIGMNAPGLATDIFEASYFNTPPSNTSNVHISMHKVSHLEYWNLERISGTSNVWVTLFWEDILHSGIQTPNHLVVSRYDLTDAEWKNQGQSVMSAGPSSGQLTSNGAITTFGNITFGTVSNGNILPVELVAFDAAAFPDHNLITWATASEHNNSHFIIEKSEDGQSFESIGWIAGQGSSTYRNEYQFSDNDVYAETVYYRLRQVDIDGAEKLSEIRRLKRETQNQTTSIQVYPNPASIGNTVQVNIAGNMDTPSNFRVFHINGTVYATGQWNVNQNQLTITNDWPAGIYLLQVMQGGQIISQQKIIVSP